MCIFICHIGMHDRIWIFEIIGEIQTVHFLYIPCRGWPGNDAFSSHMVKSVGHMNGHFADQTT